MTLFWILWVFNALMSLVPIYFFFAGLRDGSINSRNIGLWGIIMLIVAAVLFGTLWLEGNNHQSLSRIVLLLAAVPGVLVLLYFLIVITSKPKWN